MSQLCLPPPFGLGQKCHHVSMRAPNHLAKQVAEIAEDHGCPGFIADKVEQCIHHSGRYDCLVTPSINPKKLGHALWLIGGGMVHTPMADTRFGPHRFDYDHRRHPSQTDAEQQRAMYGSYSIGGVSVLVIDLGAAVVAPSYVSDRDLDELYGRRAARKQLRELLRAF